MVFLCAFFLDLCTSWQFHPAVFDAISLNAHKNSWMETAIYGHLCIMSAKVSNFFSLGKRLFVTFVR